MNDGKILINDYELNVIVKNELLNWYMIVWMIKWNIKLNCYVNILCFRTTKTMCSSQGQKRIWICVEGGQGCEPPHGHDPLPQVPLPPVHGWCGPWGRGRYGRNQKGKFLSNTPSTSRIFNVAETLSAP